jgi:DNA repair protein RecO (recombination protein O)
VSTLHTTKAIVLRTIKYGETSLVVTAYTELYGMQSYLVNGVRSSSKKGSGKANLFQPGAILDLIVYHNEFKNLQRIKEFKWHYLYQHVFRDVVKNSILLFMVELLLKSVKQQETNADLYNFMEEALIQVDISKDKIAANFPLYFAMHLAAFFGFQLQDNYAVDNTLLDLQEGYFVKEKPIHPYFVEGKQSELMSELLKIMQPGELEQLLLNQEIRRSLLNQMQLYYALHIQDFGQLKSLPILQEVLN